MTISTLLDMTQAILSALGSDQVANVGDTPESVQVAECIRQTYFNMLGRYDLPEHNQLAQLVKTSSATPTLMTIPTNASRIEWTKYFDTNPTDVSSLQVDQFGAFSHGLNTDLVGNTSGWALASNQSQAITTGSVTFTVSTLITLALPPANGNTIFAYPTMGVGSVLPSTAPSMSGTITSVTNTSDHIYSITANFTTSTGSGTYPSWLLTQNATSVPFGPGYIDVQKVTIEEFFAMTNAFDPTESNVGAYNLVVTPEAGGSNQNFNIYFKNDHTPQFYCILSNNYVIFDSFDSEVDTFLQDFKTESYIWTIPSWTVSNNFVPSLDPQHFPLLLNDAKSLAFEEIKLMPHKKAEDEVARQLVSLQKWKAISGKPTYFEELPSFGRGGGGMINRSIVTKVGPNTYITG